MRYPEFCNSVIDITKAPYFADNTGKTDSTAAIRRAIDDVLVAYIKGIEDVKKKLLELSETRGGENAFVGAESGKFIDGEVYVTFPEILPPTTSIYFPNGTYLVSDTVSYTFDNLNTRQSKNYTCELCRHIHIFGESRENTVIKLRDNCEGFEKGKCKPVISFNRAAKEDTETTNCAQMNMLEDITIDCGRGNEGAAGVLFASSNCGRIENVTVKGCGGPFGIYFDYNSEACVDTVSVSGFDYGIKTGLTSPVVLDVIDLSGNKVAGMLTKDAHMCCKNITCEGIPLFEFVPGKIGRYYCDGFSPIWCGNREGAYIFTGEEKKLQSKPFPKNNKNPDDNDWAFVDDFGAVADGETDSTVAIQKAMNSGKPRILFGRGAYKIERTVKVPSSVKSIDFRFATLIPGMSLIIGEMACMFEISEESEDTLFAEHLPLDERGSGFYRVFGQTARRQVVLKDISVSSALYYNTAFGGEVYFDNCFTHTNHYSQNAELRRDGYIPVFCRMIPVELHNQKAYGRNLNAERADLEVLNDASELVIDGFKVEGPGTLVKTENGGRTQINLFNAPWWGNKIEDHALFELHDSETSVCGGHIFLHPKDETFCLTFRVLRKGEEERIYISDCTEKLEGTDALGRDLGRRLNTISII